MLDERQSIVPYERVEESILTIRGMKVILDADIAELYGVSTKRLNQAVKRNLERFPSDFMFQLTSEEKQEVVTDCDHLSSLKFSPTLPYAFTEQGTAMLSSVLRSERAIQVNITIMRAFVRMRRWAVTYDELARRIDDLEANYDAQLATVFQALRQLMIPPDPPQRKIGFRTLDGDEGN